jgi:hypothetical protein
VPSKRDDPENIHLLGIRSSSRSRNPFIVFFNVMQGEGDLDEAEAIQPAACLSLELL